MNQMLFTTSWDDGSVHDLRVAELLTRYGIPGTFYVPIHFNGRGDKFSEYRRRLNEKELIELSHSHEIGAHTVHHTELSSLSDPEAMKELTESKKALEDITGKPISMFCFPRGDYSERTIELVRKAGFAGARTTKKLFSALPQDPYQIGVSIQAAPFPLRKKNASSFYYGRLFDPTKSYIPKIFTLPSLWPKLFSWKMLSRGFFDYALKNGNYFHLYGHSWELEKYGMWQELESFLKFVKEHPNVTYLSNSEVIEHIGMKNLAGTV